MEPKTTTTTTTTTTVAPDVPAAPSVVTDATGLSAPEGKFHRPEALYFVGALRPDGEPVEHLAGYGIAARDYEKDDPMLARLTDAQVSLALESKLYRRTKPAETGE